MASYSTLGLEIAASVLVGLFAGRFLDRRFGTQNTFAFVGLLFGIAAAVRAVHRALERANQEALRIEQEEREARKKFNQDGNRGQSGKQN